MRIFVASLMLMVPIYSMEQLSKLSNQQLADAQEYVICHQEANNRKKRKAISLATFSALVGISACVMAKKYASKKEMWQDLQRRVELEMQSRQRAKL